ncbi:MurR/RpiR family transcriptional regulator [Staphylococcus auricularis]|uniref:MurR/RpiR family transcriptional regulator n=1 Tax=Staphylococcus auricularis TaxID=29379 RepID=A0ABX5IC18_9STAP|nr:MurR/RpiR family transcriptional regulator [Staphylococcus auricularis]MCE5038618.1 MurR/RpiR family transcriptional regulator [Staphylococcus auricularis]MEB6570141.1 MurR/RpiR family transcriptional regulator [Staphylococcus auricularis]PTH13064.1 MurR/RpiR family transcriptional regulator [Staphylococcus auricularis]
MKNILYTIGQEYNNFTHSEQKIADYILNAPHRVINMTAIDLSKATDTSPTSIARFLKKVTDGGYRELQNSISHYIPEHATQNNRLEIASNESVESLTSKMVSRVKRTVDTVSEYVDPLKVDYICDMIKASRTIFLFGYGSSAIVATDLYQKLTRLGINVRLITETHLFTVTLSSHDARDCIIFITNRGEHSELLSMARVANDHHIPMVTISSNDENPIAELSDVTLVHGPTDENDFRMAATTSMFAQLFIIDVLFYRYIALNFRTALDTITQSKLSLGNYHKHLSNIYYKH